MEESRLARLIHEAYGEKQSIEFSAGSNIDEYIDYIERLLVAAGFHPESVKQGFLSKAEEIDIEEEQRAANEEDLHTE